jgi:hypothetical protein
VLQHDLRADANTGGRLIIQAHGGMSGVDMSMSTSISLDPPTDLALWGCRIEESAL